MDCRQYDKKEMKMGKVGKKRTQEQKEQEQ